MRFARGHLTASGMESGNTNARWKKWLARLALVIISPIAFLGLLELVLMLTGWATPQRLLKQVEHEGETFWATNPFYSRVVFDRQAAPAPAPVWVPVGAPIDARRVVLIGESAAHGFPIAMFNIARVTEAVWNLSYPDEPVELIGLTMTGINSHILRFFVDEALRMEPDLVILYAGHNEVLGPFGAAAVHGHQGWPRGLIRAWLRWQHTRTASWLNQRIGGLRGASESDQPVWRGLTEFADKQIALDDPALDRTYAHARQNFEAMLRSTWSRQVPMLWVMPAVNLNDWPPLGSAPETISDAEALDAWRSGQPERLRSAGQVYRLARLRERRDNWDEAWALYRLARDLDLYRFRFDSRLHQLFGEIAAKQPDGWGRLVDADDAFHAANPDVTSDRQYFVEHVHFTLAGRIKLARVLVDEMADQWGLSAAEPIDQQTVRDALFFTPLHEADLWRDTLQVLLAPPFPDQPEAQERALRVRHKERMARQSFEQSRSLDWATDRYRQAQAYRPNDPLTHVIAGQVFGSGQYWSSAEVALRRSLTLHPNRPDALYNLLRMYLIQGRLDDGHEVAEQLERSHPIEGDTAGILGDLYTLRQEPERALPYLLSALQHRPDDSYARYSLGLVYRMLDDEAAAMRELRRYLELRPSDADAQHQLAWLLLTQPDATSETYQEALLLVLEAHRRIPGDPRIRGTLALAYAASGQRVLARREAEIAIDAATRAGRPDAVAELRRRLQQFGVE